jgi:hypothetical protein
MGWTGCGRSGHARQEGQLKAGPKKRGLTAGLPRESSEVLERTSLGPLMDPTAGAVFRGISHRLPRRRAGPGNSAWWFFWWAGSRVTACACTLRAALQRRPSPRKGTGKSLAALFYARQDDARNAWVILMPVMQKDREGGPVRAPCIPAPTPRRLPRRNEAPAASGAPCSLVTAHRSRDEVSGAAPSRVTGHAVGPARHLLIHPAGRNRVSRIATPVGFAPSRAGHRGSDLCCRCGHKATAGIVGTGFFFPDGVGRACRPGPTACGTTVRPGHAGPLRATAVRGVPVQG